MKGETEMAEEGLWYVVHTYSGYENKVAQNLETLVENRRLHDLIQEVKVPTEIVPEIKESATAGITGIAGPGGALPGKPVGTVYLAGADGRSGKVWVMRLTLGGYRERAIIRTRAALYALDLLRRMALGLEVPDAVLTDSDCLTCPETLDF